MKPFIVAHRGASTRKRENTLAAFALAIADGADFVEFDIRRSADQEYVVHHDPTVGSKLIAAATLGELSWHANALGYEIPILSDVLALAANRIMLDVELKEEGYESQIVDILLASRPIESFVVTTFNEQSIQRIKSRCAKVRCGLLLGMPDPPDLIRTRLRELFPMDRALRARADFVAPNWQLLRFGFVQRARRSTLPVWVWTVNSQKMMSKYLGTDGIEALITDAPREALALRAALNR